jgi:protein-S-isoprenylcysteine O-methyltransferase Ste14
MIMNKFIYPTYAVLCYAIFLLTFLYLIGFMTDIFVPKTINSGHDSSIGVAILVNIFLIGLFGIQHSLMARPWFKNKWTKIIPKPLERSTYVLFSSLALIILFYFWKPLPINIWKVSSEALALTLTVLAFTGWVIVLVSTFLINHFDLFGLRQVYLHLMGHPEEILKFKTPLFYKFIRHPIYFGFLLAFWATPNMSAGHLLFALGMTVYIFIGISHEETDLVRTYGDQYENYRKKTARIIPFIN